MAEDNSAKFLEYEELKIQEKQVAARLKELKEELTPLVSDDEKVNCRYGVIELKKRDNWKYTPATTQMADDLKARQKEEVAKGEATNNPTFFIEYRQKEREEAAV